VPACDRACSSPSAPPFARFHMLAPHEHLGTALLRSRSHPLGSDASTKSSLQFPPPHSVVIFADRERSCKRAYVRHQSLPPSADPFGQLNRIASHLSRPSASFLRRAATHMAPSTIRYSKRACSSCALERMAMVMRLSCAQPESLSAGSSRRVATYQPKSNHNCPCISCRSRDRPRSASEIVPHLLYV
jgi:hypothetical protein